MVALAERPRRERHVPRVAVFGLMLRAVWPRTTERLLRRALFRFHLGAPQPRTEGALFEPSPGPGPVHGHRPPLVTTARMMLWVLGETTVILASDALAAARRERHQRLS